jgi:hypothetical protein
LLVVVRVVDLEQALVFWEQRQAVDLAVVVVIFLMDGLRLLLAITMRRLLVLEELGELGLEMRLTEILVATVQAPRCLVLQRKAE